MFLSTGHSIGWPWVLLSPGALACGWGLSWEQEAVDTIITKAGSGLELQRGPSQSMPQFPYL